MPVFEVVLRCLARRVLADVAVGVVVRLRDGDSPSPSVSAAPLQADGEPFGENRAGQLRADRSALVGTPWPWTRTSRAMPRPSRPSSAARSSSPFSSAKPAAEAAVENEQPVTRAAPVQFAHDDGGGEGAALRVAQPGVGRREIEPCPVPDGMARQVDQDCLVRRPPVRNRESARRISVSVPSDSASTLKPPVRGLERAAARSSAPLTGGEAMRAAVSVGRPW